MAGREDNLDYCGRLVHRADRDRFLTALTAPADRRPGLFALYAFNTEISKTREAVSEPMIGSIRLQWWREAVDEIYAGTARQHEVVRALADAVNRHELSRAPLDALIDARERDLDDLPPARLADFEDYARATSSRLIESALEVLDARNEASTAAADHVGVAWALIGTLRALPHQLRARRHRLPMDVLEEAGVDLRAMAELMPHPELAQAVETICGYAARRLASARSLRSEAPSRAFAALASAVLADGYLQRFRMVRYDPFDPRLARPAPGRPLTLVWRSIVGRY